MDGSVGMIPDRRRVDPCGGVVCVGFRVGILGPGTQGESKENRHAKANDATRDTERITGRHLFVGTSDKRPALIWITWAVFGIAAVLIAVAVFVSHKQK